MRSALLAGSLVFSLVLSSELVRGDSTAPAEGSVCLQSICFPETALIEESDFPLRNIAELRYLGFSLYTSALYVADHIEDVTASLGKEPLCLELHYHRSFTRTQINEAAEDAISSNPDVDLDVIRPALDKAYEIHQDVTKGDRYQVIFIPDTGTIFIRRSASK